MRSKCIKMYLRYRVCLVHEVIKSSTLSCQGFSCWKKPLLVGLLLFNRAVNNSALTFKCEWVIKTTLLPHPCFFRHISVKLLELKLIAIVNRNYFDNEFLWVFYGTLYDYKLAARARSGPCNRRYCEAGIWGWLENGSPFWRLLVPFGAHTYPWINSYSPGIVGWSWIGCGCHKSPFLFRR